MEIDLDRARELLDEGKAVFVDIRDPVSFAAGHIPGAVRVDDWTVEDFLATADPERTIVVCCYHGISSLGGAAFFRERGLSGSWSLAGGFADWQAARLPQEQGPPPEGNE